MSTPLTINPENVVIPAGGQRSVRPFSDYVRFDTLPSGVLVSLNGGADVTLESGRILQGLPGAQQVESVRFTNPTGSELTVQITTGSGQMTVAGVAVISGAVPLPTGAATAALQTTGNTSLASILAAFSALATSAAQTTANNFLSAINTLLGSQATAALQTTGNGYLQTLANPQVRTPRVLAFNAGGDVDVTGARQIDIINTHASISVTIVIAGQPDYTLGPGKGVGWPMLNPMDTSYGNIRVTAPASATGTIEYVL